jgi:hypothetical protein
MKYDAFIDAEGDLALQLGFLARALSSNDTRPFMNYIYVETDGTEDGLIGVATDGRHLHIVGPLSGFAKSLGMTSGYWKVLKNGKNVWAARIDDSQTAGWTYPNWRKVIPTGKEEYITYFNGFDLKDQGKSNNELAVFLHGFPDTTVINLKYIHDLGTSLNWEVFWYGSEKPIKFTKDNFTAVIMPTRQ